MKKILTVICALFMLIMASCGNSNKVIDATTTPSTTESISAEATIKETRATEVSSQQESTQTSSKTIEKTTVLSTSTFSNVETQEVPPYILTESLRDLKQIKSATNTMNETEFSEYMKNNFSTERFNGMDNIENAEKYLADFEEAYIVYVDEFSEDTLMAYYIESGDISYKIPVDDSFVMTFTYYVNPEKTFEYKEGDIVKHLKTYESNGMVIELYENTDDENEGLYGNIKYAKTNIPFFTNIKISVDLFESILERINIAKVGDLINTP